jgi:signal transduction histidine kinase
MNLINNAVEAMTGVSANETIKKRTATGGEINITTTLRKDHIVTDVANSGPGISQPVVDAFSRFDCRRLEFDRLESTRRAEGASTG